MLTFYDHGNIKKKSFSQTATTTLPTATSSELSSELLSLISRVTQVDHCSPEIRPKSSKGAAADIVGLKVIRLHWTRGSLLMSLPSVFPLTRRLHLKTAFCPLGCAAWWEEEEQMRFYYNRCNFPQELGAAGALTGPPNIVLAASLYTCTRPTAVCRSSHRLSHWSSLPVKVTVQSFILEQVRKE